MKVILQFSYVVLILLISSCGQGTHSSLIFSEKNDAKIKKLIAQMTIEEKVNQLAASYNIHPKYSNANYRLGIPNLVSGECLHGVMADGATLFPQAIAMASSWDLDMIEKVGHVGAKEARVFGIHQAYAPMIAVVRDVRWGRIEESYGEDPFLVGNIGAAYIKGLQGTGSQRFDKNHIFACAKHYVADGERESN